MLRIQTCIIGGLLVLTGAAGYLFQDLALSLKIKGPLADDAIFVLSDGKERHEMDFIPTTGSAGENVWWIVHNSMKSMPATLRKETMLLNKRVVPKRQNPFGMPPPEALL